MTHLPLTERLEAEGFTQKSSDYYQLTRPQLTVGVFITASAEARKSLTIQSLKLPTEGEHSLEISIDNAEQTHIIDVLAFSGVNYLHLPETQGARFKGLNLINSNVSDLELTAQTPPIEPVLLEVSHSYLYRTTLSKTVHSSAHVLIRDSHLFNVHLGPLTYYLEKVYLGAPYGRHPLVVHAPIVNNVRNPGTELRHEHQLHLMEGAAHLQLEDGPGRLVTAHEYRTIHDETVIALDAPWHAIVGTVDQVRHDLTQGHWDGFEDELRTFVEQVAATASVGT